VVEVARLSNGVRVIHCNSGVSVIDFDCGVRACRSLYGVCGTFVDICLVIADTSNALRE
jgi:hypothetical protein